MMRAALWFVGLFALAVTVALFAGNNQGIVSLFWHPYRVDLSLNMVLFVLLAILRHQRRHAGAFCPGDAAAPRRPQRRQQKERQMYQALVESLSHLRAGRYIACPQIGAGSAQTQ